jgi:hypothetical protein
MDHKNTVDVFMKAVVTCFIVYPKKDVKPHTPNPTTSPAIPSEAAVLFFFSFLNVNKIVFMIIVLFLF